MLRKVKNMKLGVIGAGNMGGAFIGGIVKKGIIKSEDIICSSPVEAEREKAKASYGINTTSDNKNVVKESEIIIFAVKPQVIPTVIEEIKDYIDDDRLFISIVAGKSIEWFEEAAGKSFKLIRTMPNTPALVGEGMTGVSPNKNVSDEDLKMALELLSALGKAAVVPEKLMDAVVAASGSSPAYVFMLIEAMADGAVRLGMPRALAYKFVAQTVLGSAKMVLETGKHPGELKDMVCSPAGTTIEAVRVLEEKGFRSALIEAMDACAEISKKL
jgi:pyrroline-5-carboxylate reductase